ncbi:MAG: hypothetical protein HKN87_06880 [Saprospiraceae bacterium]|nr:hypothetical protein [Saprospiraceae bacterium]
MLSNFHILTISFKETSLEDLANYAIQGQGDALRLELLKVREQLKIDELYYLHTCNRILYFFSTEDPVDQNFVKQLFGNSVDYSTILHKQDLDCLSYFLHVASSLHSMVVGEREILKQIKVAYDQQAKWGLTSDNMRLVIEHTIRGAKRVYRETSISERPISVVSIAIRKLAEFSLGKDARFILVGAGTTIRLVVKHLTKKGFNQFTIYNRSISNAQRLAEEVEGSAGSLVDLANHRSPFDCLIACTAATDPIVTYELASQISNQRVKEKIWIDLGMPGDIERSLLSQCADGAIDLQTLEKLSEGNLKVRLDEVQNAESVLDQMLTELTDALYHRKIERAFQLIPAQIKSIKQKAYAEVFQKELQSIDPDAQELITRMMDYMEKKCIGIPMKAAKEAIL